MSNTDRQIILGCSLAVTSIIAGVATYNWLHLKRQISKGNVYETKQLLNEYLLCHYASKPEALLFDFGPSNALDFPKRCADLCIKYTSLETGLPSRAFDSGCAVGRSSFELCRHFNEVIGLDFSANFIAACDELKSKGSMLYSMRTEGFLDQNFAASIDQSIDRSRASFRVGDACCLDADLEGFGCVLAANLICRLPRPDMFLLRCSSLVAKGGILVITSPYTFMTEYTAPEHMIGGFVRNGRTITGFDGLKSLLGPCFDLIAEEEMPFLIRETRRKHQWTVAHATVWRRK